LSARSLALAAVVALGAKVSPLSSQVPAGAQIVPVDSIEVRGNVRQSAPTVLAELGIRLGDRVTWRDIQRGVQRLYATGQYDDVRIYASGSGSGPVALLVEVVERPFIISYSFRGSEHVGESAIRDTVGLTGSAPLDPAAVHEASYRVRAELADRGYVQARVDTSLVAAGRPGEYRLVFEVTEGRRLVVAGLDFQGNNDLSDGELIASMSVRPEGFFWWQSGEYREDKYRQDLEVNLVEYYGSRGYLDFRVLGDSMAVDPETGKSRLIVRVDEGRQYRIADFQVEGNRYFPTTILAARFNPGARSLLSRLPLIGSSKPAGDPVFDTHAWQDATDQVRQLYRNAGFLYANIEPIVERLPDGPDSLPRVGLKWRIEESDQAFVNLVNIAGNTTTHERVIRERLMLLPGDVYGDERVVSSYQTIQGLGFFEPLPPDQALDVRPQQDGDIDVTFRVKEKQTGTINFGATLAPSAGLAGFIGYEQPNLFGQAKVGHFRWVFGTRTNDIEIGYSDPAFRGSRVSFGVNLRNSRDRYSYVGLGKRRQVGGSAVVGMPLFGARWTRLSFRYTLLRDEYDSGQDELDLEQRQLLAVGTRSAFEISVTRDTRNHPLFPTSGTRNVVSLEFVGGPLGGDGDYHKLTFESTWFTPVARLRSDPAKTPIDLALGLGVLGGAIVGENPFYHERFFMGGVQYGPKLRGYEELTITPQGHIPTETPGFSQLDRVGSSFFGLYGSLGLVLSGNLFVNVFYDAGNVWYSASALNPTDLIRGAGIGVSLVTPVGPLGLDWAYAFDRRDVYGRPDPGWKLHFRFGQVF
jgi:outer membrane protein insertion porin family